MEKERFCQKLFWGVQRWNNRYFPDLGPLLFYFSTPKDMPALTGGCEGLFWCSRSIPLLVSPSDLFLLLLFGVVCFSDALNLFFKLPVQAIADVYTVEQLKQKALQNDEKLEPFCGIIYGYISTLDIDDNPSKVIRNRWWAAASVNLYESVLVLLPLTQNRENNISVQIWTRSKTPLEDFFKDKSLLGDLSLEKAFRQAGRTCFITSCPVFQFSVPLCGEWGVKHVHVLQRCLCRLTVNLCQLRHPRRPDRPHGHPSLLLPVWHRGGGDAGLHSKRKELGWFSLGLSCKAWGKLHM